MSQTHHSHLGIRQLAEQVQQKETSVASLVTRRLEKAIQSESVFIALNHNIIDDAQAIDQLSARARSSTKPLSPLLGLPITLKDLFDVRGEITLAGSKALKHTAKVASQDCDVIAPLRKAGLLFLGRTNMSEFAFSGLGLNPHYGNPKSIWQREIGRLPGGSSSGCAVSVAEGIVAATMGSDTAGSCRVPAAFNGIVGVKPSYGRYSLNAVYPLSPTSDAPGAMAIDLDSCFILDQVITAAYSGTGPLPRPLPEAQPLGNNLSLLVPESVVLEDLDEQVSASFERALGWLEEAGVEIKYRPMPVLERCVDMFFQRAIVGHEAWQHHQSLLEQYEDEYDPFVVQRLKSYRLVTAQEQQSRYREKAKLAVDFNRVMQQQQVDGVLYPTVACVPPTIAETLIPENTAKINLRCLRNTSTANYFNGCSISLPCNLPGAAPVGLMVSLSHNQDDYLYQVAATVEKILNNRRGI